MKKVVKTSFLFIALSAGLLACDKQLETLQADAFQDFYPLQTQKTFLYRLDSTVPASFGSALIVKSYQAKDLSNPLLPTMKVVCLIASSVLCATRRAPNPGSLPPLIQLRLQRNGWSMLTITCVF